MNGFMEKIAQEAFEDELQKIAIGMGPGSFAEKSLIARGIRKNVNNEDLYKIIRKYRAGVNRQFFGSHDPIGKNYQKILIKDINSGEFHKPIPDRDWGAQRIRYAQNNIFKKLSPTQTNIDIEKFKNINNLVSSIKSILKNK